MEAAVPEREGGARQVAAPHAEEGDALHARAGAEHLGKVVESWQPQHCHLVFSDSSGYSEKNLPASCGACYRLLNILTLQVRTIV
jgi:hypothetical protein